MSLVQLELVLLANIKVGKNQWNHIGLLIDSRKVARCLQGNIYYYWFVNFYYSSIMELGILPCLVH